MGGHRVTLMHFKVVDDRFIYLKDACQWQPFDDCFPSLRWDVLDVVAPLYMSHRPEVEG